MLVKSCLNPKREVLGQYGRSFGDTGERVPTVTENDRAFCELFKSYIQPEMSMPVSQQNIFKPKSLMFDNLA